jgi:hypothetical protein
MRLFFDIWQWETGPGKAEMKWPQKGTKSTKKKISSLCAVCSFVAKVLGPCPLRVVFAKGDGRGG